MTYSNHLFMLIIDFYLFSKILNYNMLSTLLMILRLKVLFILMFYYFWLLEVIVYYFLVPSFFFTVPPEPFFPLLLVSSMISPRSIASCLAFLAAILSVKAFASFSFLSN